MRPVNVLPPAALVVLALTWGSEPPAGVLAVAALFLGGAVIAAVNHAEVIAHRVCQPVSRARSPEARTARRATAARIVSSAPTTMSSSCARVTAV
jgi:Ca2+:H+ antiporter